LAALRVNPLPPSDADRKQKKKIYILENLFSLVLSEFKKHHPSGNLDSINFGIFKNLKFRIFMDNILPISLYAKQTLWAVMG